jgi:hypothetical protein
MAIYGCGEKQREFMRGCRGISDASCRTEHIHRACDTLIYQQMLFTPSGMTLLGSYNLKRYE